MGPSSHSWKVRKPLLKAAVPDSNVLAFSSEDERQSNMVVKGMGCEFKSHCCVTLDRLLSPSGLQLSPLLKCMAMTPPISDCSEDSMT